MSTPILRMKSQQTYKPPLISPLVRGLNLVAIKQTDVRIDTVDGPLDARLIKIMQLTRAPAVTPQHRSLPLPFNSGQSSNLRPQRKYVQHSIRSESAKVRTGKHVTLRAVGEVLSDESGKLYEIRDEELHLLGKLVRNQIGRLFEVCDSSPENLNHTTQVIETATALSSELKTTRRVNRSSSLARLFRRLIEGLLRKVAPMFASEEKNS